MMKIYIGIITLFVFVSCSVTKDLGGNTFNYKSMKRTLELIFVNDTVCKLKNTFHCKDIDEDIKELVIDCKYHRKKDTIYLRNINCGKDDCEFSLSYEIPIQTSLDCEFLNKEYRKNKSTIGPNYATEYRKYGLVPMIDIDTLYIQKNKIVLYKQNKRESIGFIFK